MITKYHRPQTLEEAIALIGRPGAIPLAGGTTLVADRDGSSVEVVDLQALPLAGIDTESGTVRMGATTRLQDIADSNAVPRLVCDLARREAPRSIRNAATIGGTIAVADPESELLTGLLALGAVVTVADDGTSSDISLDDMLDDRSILAGGLVTGVTITTAGRSAADRTGRTPMDRPIVVAVAHQIGDVVSVAVSGVAERPVLVDPDAIADLEPPPDFRGSADYRRTLASVLVDRVLAALEADR